MSTFINDLSAQCRDYNNPKLATTQAKSLDLLSAGIYTEEERFIFELLQNAVDAYNDTEEPILRIKIIIKDNYLVFLHNGNEFTERDIEGICDVGNGNKMLDSKKIGYKGIGFKSVFMHSTCVTIDSGKYCFKFDKSNWDQYWDSKWGKRKSSDEVSMPWQIIPIDSECPIQIEHSDYNVATYLQSSNIVLLSNKIEHVLSNGQFLLFLKANNISLNYYNEEKLIINLTKKTEKDIVTLFYNDIEVSRWLVRTKYVNVPEDVREKISKDISTPSKIKESKEFDLSFAISLDKGNRIQSIENSVLYTYLPTSFSFGFPFLVNANFITDAGRQHIVSNSEWNRMIISCIPYEFLNWMSKISQIKTNYYKVLPSKIKEQGELQSLFNKHLDSAISNIAFIPSLKKSLLKASDAVIDRVDISETITPKVLIKHINKQYIKTFSSKSIIANKGISILKEYGVFVFDAEKLQELFNDQEAFIGIDVEKDIQLIDFLFNYYKNNAKEQSSLIHILEKTKFLYSEDDILDSPDNLYFPSDYREEESIAEEAKILHPTLFEHIKQNKELESWLKEVGVSEMDDISIIKNLICKPGFVTIENAIDVMKFVFKVNKRINIFDEISSYYLNDILIKTKKGNLKKAKDLFFGSEFHPDIDIEACCNEDIFPALEYCNGHEIGEWYNFFKKLGVNSSFELTHIMLNREEALKYRILKEAIEASEKVYFSSNNGCDYYFYCHKVHVSYVPLVYIEQEDNYQLSQIIWNSVFANFPENYYRMASDNIYGQSGFIDRFFHLESYGLKISFIDYMFHNVQEFPASNFEMLRAQDLFLNTPVAKELYGPYLPYINIECNIHEEWLKMLPLKKEPDLKDYLTLLSNIAQDEEKAENNRERISKVYQRIVDTFAINEPYNKNLLENWAASHNILAQDNTFCNPTSLRYITLDGFGKKGRVFIDKSYCNEKTINLLKLFGVKIITERSISPKFEHDIETSELKTCLLSKSKVLALLKVGEKPSKEEFEKALIEINRQLDDSHFYKCDCISLTYGNDEDTINKVAFGIKNNFYYTGELSISMVDPLLTPLCNYLNLGHKERELLVSMFENMPAIRVYLKGKEYEIEYLEDIKDDSSHTFNATISNVRDDAQLRIDARTGYRGEIIVYEKLKAMGYNPTCPSISTSSDYEEIIENNGNTYYCKPNMGRYDITFTTDNGIKYYIEVKATSIDKSSQTNMPISYREISMIEEYNDVEKQSYIIARVFNVNNKSPEIYLLKGYMIGDNKI